MATVRKVREPTELEAQKLIECFNVPLGVECSARVAGVPTYVARRFYKSRGMVRSLKEAMNIGNSDKNRLVKRGRFAHLK